MFDYINFTNIVDPSSNLGFGPCNMNLVLNLSH